MDQRDRDSPRSQVPSHDAPQAADSAESVLQLAIDLYGPALLSQPDKLRRQFDEQCPAATFDASLLLSALAEGVPQALMGVSSGDELRRLVPRLEQSLIDRRALDPFGATWAVATWATVLRADSAGLAMSLDAMAPAPPDADRGEDAPVVIPAVVDVAVPAAASRPAAVEPFPVAPSQAGHIESVAVQQTLSRPPRVPVDVPVVVEPRAVDDVAPLVEAATATPVAVVPAAAVGAEPVVEPPPIEPLPIAAPAIVVASAAPVDPVAVVADAEATAASPPAWSTAAPAAAATRRFHRGLGIAGVVVAIVVAWVVVRSIATRGPDSAQTPPVAAAPMPAPNPLPSAEPVPVPTAAPAVAPMTSGIVAVTSDEPLVGDGRPHDVFVTIDPQRTDVRSVVVRFIGGDGAWPAGPRVLDVAPEALRNGRVPVGAIALRTTKPASATFQYALTTADGRQTAPFVRQFTFAPVAGRPPVLVDVAAPGGLVVGKPFAVTIDYEAGDARLASVERKVLGPPGDADGAVTVTAVDGLTGPKPGRLRYPFDAIDRPSRSTVTLTLIDQEGLRSEPRRVVLDVSAPAPAPATAAAPAGANSAAAAAAACTRETCGSVVSVRDIDAAGAPPGRARTYEVIVRLDDRSIRSLVLQGTWKLGRRVRVTGDRVVAVSDAAGTSPTRGRMAPPGRLLPESLPIVER